MTQRFTLLLHKDWQEHGKFYLSQSLILFVALTISFTWMSIYKLSNFHSDDTFIILNDILVFMAISTFIVLSIPVGSTLMAPRGDKKSRINFLNIPASNFKRYFFRWFIVTIGYAVAFFIIFWLAEALRVLFCSLYFSELDIPFINLKYLITKDAVYHSDIYFFSIILTFGLFIQSLFIIGATFWQRLSFTKTFVVVLLIVLFFIFSCKWAILHFYGNYYSFQHMLSTLKIFKPFNTQESRMLLVACIFMVLALLNWIFAYFSFKERIHSSSIKRTPIIAIGTLTLTWIAFIVFIISFSTDRFHHTYEKTSSSINEDKRSSHQSILLPKTPLDGHYADQHT